ncbi:NAD-dependent succinate-semialdehyde dehydrogenase [Pigmentiphaga sp. H8]|uniref:NAD-dependent succinate-semialdehyde dehydrogenase n=1 Tax=unclassified Pigmentiphaga TaxID=2626614 RepID=UPI000F5A3DEA|nr:NAD-dependent succinate-semialdehyde dehydrogenase [Pigmentiphaga sp. H8]AZG10897.1 NAD-dependent succinate-semialdehyde dehydrogenase [Pigmentiphaga sp. H8]
MLSIANLPTDLYIDGNWAKPAQPRSFTVSDPATGERVAQVADAGLDDARAAVDAAAAALPAWRDTPPRTRAEVLRKVHLLMLERLEELARIITLENGKPLADSRAETRYAAEFFRWYSEEACRNLGSVSHAPAGGYRILVQHQPIGVVALVTPWNFPSAMGARKIAPALAAGCTVLVKPASLTPLSMLALADILAEAGVPDGVVNIVPTSRSGPLVDLWLHDPRVRLVSFTGSTEVGRILLKAAADQVLKTPMELGGNAPFLVLDDADVQAAVDGAMIAKMRNMGEACTAANRFYVGAGVYDAFVRAFAERMRAQKIGHGLDEANQVGSLIDAATRDKVEELVEDAVSRGAKVLCGGERLSGPGYFYPPTVLGDVPADSRVLSEEIFGPVAPIVRVASEDEMVELANGTEYGLAAYLYTRDLAKGLKLAERLEFGMVALNRGLVSDPAAPFGGVKQSGLGREGSWEGMQEYMETKYVAVEW